MTVKLSQLWFFTILTSISFFCTYKYNAYVTSDPTAFCMMRYNSLSLTETVAIVYGLITIPTILSIVYLLRLATNKANRSYHFFDGKGSSTDKGTGTS